MAVTLQDIQAAHGRIRDFIYCSPRRIPTGCPR